MGKILFTWLLLFFTSSAFSQKNWHAYVFLAEECPICNYMGKPLSMIAEKYGSQVEFYAVFPVKRSNYKTTQLFKEQYGLTSFETLLDRNLEWTEKLGATVTPEVVVTDSTGEILYRGRINNAYYAPGKMKHSSIRHELDEALSAITNGNIVAKPWPSAIGCYITRYAGS